MKEKSEHRQGRLDDIKRDVADYFTGTTVHGFRYVVQGRSLLERVVWALFILLGFWFCCQSVYKLYEHWEGRTVETTIDEIGLHIQELPFPAITMCDTQSQKMPRRNRWMLLETLLNSLSLNENKAQTNELFPGKYPNACFHKII